MSEPKKVRAARAEVETCKAEMIDTVRELQQRLQPSTLASGAWEAAKNKGANLAEDAVDAVKSRPLAVGGVAAALALFLARDPIKDAAKRLYDGMASAKDEPPELKASSTAPPARRRATRKPSRTAPKKTTKTEKPA